MSKIKQAQSDKQSKIDHKWLLENYLYDQENGHFYSKVPVDVEDGCHGYRKIWGLYT